MSLFDKINSLLNEMFSEQDSDFLIYAGEINRLGHDKVVNVLRNGRQHKNLVMLLHTVGGDAHAAFKIARACQNIYGTVSDSKWKAPDAARFQVYVPMICKSAGTILAIGADAIYMLDEAELGPIDIQMRKPEEVGELTSTLTPVQAVQSLERQQSESFITTFGRLRSDEQMQFSTKMAAEVAQSLVSNIIGPISAQIDPMRLAETERMLKISNDYGLRLDVGNLNEGGLGTLLTGYPSHGFVIDKREAERIFNRVSYPPTVISALSSEVSFLYLGSADKEDPNVHFITPVQTDPEEGEAPADDDGPMEGPDGSGSEIREVDQTETEGSPQRRRRNGTPDNSVSK